MEREGLSFPRGHQGSRCSHLAEHAGSGGKVGTGVPRGAQRGRGGEGTMGEALLHFTGPKALGSTSVPPDPHRGPRRQRKQSRETQTLGSLGVTSKDGVFFGSRPGVTR